MSNVHHDVDLFCPTSNVLISLGQRLLCSGYTFDDRMDRVWYRWLRYGFKTWHTNSLRLVSPAGVETNLVYKLVDGHATTSLVQVLESFDFGMLATGYDLERDWDSQFEDYRLAWWPKLDPNGPLPMMRNKRDNWIQGYLSQYNGLREVARYVKYVEYGYDLSLVKADLIAGYWAASSYLSTHFHADKQMLGKIYEAIALHLESDNIAELAVASKQIDYQDSLDVIMEALE